MAKTRRSSFKLFSFGLLCLFFFVLFSGLGIWQVERLGWKLDLIQKADTRVHMQPVEAPGQNQWSQVNYDNYEYLPVTISGHYLNEKEVLVSAIAENQPGYWLMVAFARNDGTTVFVNRGFIPMQANDNTQKSKLDTHPIKGETIVTGLLRMGEGKGFFPRKNNPENNTWYTRNIEQMDAKTGLHGSAPYFIDAAAQNFINAADQSDENYPIGGLTNVKFTNNHLSYAITWFSLAIGVLAATFFLFYDERKKRNTPEPDDD